MPNAHNLRRRRAWPRAAGQQRQRAEEIATDHAENLRDTLRRIGLMKSARPEFLAELIELERDIAIAALAFDDLRRLMEEAGQAAADAAGETGPT